MNDASVESTTSRNGWSVERWHTINIVVLFALCALAFFNALGAQFVYDDKHQILENAFIQNPNLVWTGVTHDVWAFKGEGRVYSSYWRPIFVVWMAANWFFEGPDPKMWHLFNLGIHLLAVFLAYKMLIRLRIPTAVAAFATAIFAVHPTRSESVTWVAGSPDILMAIFLFGSILAFVSWHETKSTAKLLWSIGLFGIALLSKEAAFPLCLLFLGLAWIWTREAESSPKEEAVTALKTFVPFAATVIAWLAFRTMVIGSFTTGYSDSPSSNQAIASAPTIATFYLRHTFWPVNLAVLYDIKPVLLTDMPTLTYISSCFILLTALAACWVLWKRDGNYQIGLLLAILPLLPAFAITVFKHDDIVHDRYLYVPVLGVAVVFGTLIFHTLGRYRGKNHNLQTTGTEIFALALALPLAFLTLRNNESWQDEESLWRQVTLAAPRSPVGFLEYGEVLRQSRQLPEAEIAVRQAISLNCTRPNTQVVYGLIAKNRGDLAEAERRLRRAVEAHPYYELAWKQLGAVLAERGDTQGAIKVFEDAIAQIPVLRGQYTVNIAILQYQVGNKEETRRLLEGNVDIAAISRDPRTLDTFFYLGEVYIGLGARDRAKKALARYLMLTSGFTDKVTAASRDKAQQDLLNLGR